MKAKAFPVTKINKLRKQAEKARRLPPQGEIPEGWSISAVDPMKLLAEFKSLGITRGYTLRAYQRCDGGNGSGIVWALPQKAEFPAPEKEPDLKTKFKHMRMGVGSCRPPRPPDGLDDFMEAIKGDGSLWSYLQASLFSREALEFGAMWHGASWETSLILDNNPFKRTSKGGRGKSILSAEKQWKWLEPEPEKWEPTVRMEEDIITVTFFTYSGLGQETIYRHSDRYRQGSYQYETEEKIIAVGEGGVAF